MKQYQVRSTFISTKGLLIMCILMLLNVVLTAIFFSGPFQGEWFSLLLSIFLLIFLVGIVFESRTVKLFKFNRDQITLGSSVVNPDNLVKITITHKQIELTQAEKMLFRKAIFIRIVHSEELKSITEHLSKFAKEHGITIEKQMG
ncbi:hypothetical protein [Paenibacillus camelliae]|uniref:hypothetical protein n=1 Tax=Paenibacillus camelliae TaxID=512410 RepID=UPI00204264E0|nr:hypothetical protein [Paenibacillus camelliae]MCM3633541.1 hypothetical protein [Paenibacillus camelliae]